MSDSQPSQEYFRLISELASDYFYRFRLLPDGTLASEHISAGLSAITGYELWELDSRGWEILHHPDDRSTREERIRRLASGETITSEFRIITRDGSVRWLRDHACPLRDEHGRTTHIAGAGQDITERKAAEHSLEVRVRQQAAVAELGQQALCGIDLDELMQHTVQLVASALEADFCKLLQLHPDGKTLLMRAGIGWEDGLVGQYTLSAEDGSQANYTLSSNAPVIVDDLQLETRFSSPRLLHDHGVRSGLSVIIEGQDAPFGVLAAHTRDKRSFTTDDIHFLQSVANILSGAVDHDLRVRAEARLREMEGHAHHRRVVLETANRVALDILSSRFGTEALRHIAEAARVLAGARYAALGVATADGAELSEFITVGLTPQEEAAIGPRPRGAGVLGLLLKRTEPLRIDKLGDHPASVGFPARHPAMDSFLGVPIRRAEGIVGSLYLTNKQGGGPFTEADEVAVQALGAHAAVAIHNIQMLHRQRALVSRLMTAQEEERRAIAYDLHDGLTQFVMAAHAHLETFIDIGPGEMEPDAAEELQSAARYLKEAVTESRRMVNGLRLLSLEDLGLAGALGQLLEEEKKRARWEQAAFAHNIADVRFDKATETGVYRIVQEALTNARKHAATSRLEVRLHLDTRPEVSLLTVEIQDWGQGFDTNDPNVQDTVHVGLQSIAERASLLNGKYRLKSELSQGTTITVSLPVKVENEALREH